MDGGGGPSIMDGTVPIMDGVHQDSPNNGRGGGPSGQSIMDGGGVP